jgi:hypothetical protein
VRGGLKDWKARVEGEGGARIGGRKVLLGFALWVLIWTMRSLTV